MLCARFGFMSARRRSATYTGIFGESVAVESGAGEGETLLVKNIEASRVEVKASIGVDASSETVTMKPGISLRA